MISYNLSVDCWYVCLADVQFCLVPFNTGLGCFNFRLAQAIEAKKFVRTIFRNQESRTTALE